jgi:hypothetical protein
MQRYSGRACSSLAPLVLLCVFTAGSAAAAASSAAAAASSGAAATSSAAAATPTPPRDEGPFSVALGVHGTPLVLAGYPGRYEGLENLDGPVVVGFGATVGVRPASGLSIETGLQYELTYSAHAGDPTPLSLSVRNFRIPVRAAIRVFSVGRHEFAFVPEIAYLWGDPYVGVRSELHGRSVGLNARYCYALRPDLRLRAEIGARADSADCDHQPGERCGMYRLMIPFALGVQYSF